MKKLYLTIGLAALVSSSQAQGLLNFFNANATVTALSSNSVVLGSTPAGSLGTFRYELFRAAAGTTTDSGFVATGLIATNTTQAGRFQGGASVAVPGTQLGGTAAILVRGWSANLGETWAEAFAKQGVEGGFFGSSAIAPNLLLGGDGGLGFIPVPALFGGNSGIVPQSATVGFTLTWVGGSIVPEPSSMALAGLGAASLLIFRRRK